MLLLPHSRIATVPHKLNFLWKRVSTYVPQLWDVKCDADGNPTAQPRARLTGGHSRGVNSVRFSPTGPCCIFFIAHAALIICSFPAFHIARTAITTSSCTVDPVFRTAVRARLCWNRRGTSGVGGGWRRDVALESGHDQPLRRCYPLVSLRLAVRTLLLCIQVLNAVRASPSSPAHHLSCTIDCTF